MKPSKIVSFEEFVRMNEEEDPIDVDTLSGKAAEAFNSISRFYTNGKNFSTDMNHFSVVEEQRSWGNFREEAKIGETVDIPGTYKMICMIDETEVHVDVDFTATIIGQEEKDVPEPGHNDEGAAVQMKNLTIKKAGIESSEVKYSTSDVKGNFLKAVVDLMEKVLLTDYDIKGAEIYSLQKTQ